MIGRRRLSAHPHVRREAKRRLVVMLYRFALVTSCAAILGFAIAQAS